MAEFYTLPGLPSDLLSNDIVGSRLLKCSATIEGQTDVSFKDSTQLDAFGRLRVSDPVTLFSFAAQYDEGPLLFATKTVGTASIDHKPNESAVDLIIGSSDGDRVVRQNIEYQRYQPGKSQYIKITGAFGNPQDGTVKLMGYGDDKNGVFFGQDGLGIFVLLRSNVSGTVSDARKIYQQDWNKDSINGAGPSGLDFDFTKAHIYAIDMEWLGVGRVRMCVVIGGAIIMVHEFLNSGLHPSTYMTTANLPCRYEIRNTKDTASGSVLKQICAEVESEGGRQEDLAYPFSAIRSNVSIPQGAGNAIVVFATRHALTYNGIENRARFIPVGFEVLATGGRVISTILYNPALTGGTWEAVNSYSVMEASQNVTAFANGLSVKSVQATGAGNNRVGDSQGASIVSRLPFGLDVDGQNPVPLALVAYALDSNTTADFTFQWEELH